MFWDQVAGVYDVFVNVINRKTHKKLKEIVSALIEPGDDVLECDRAEKRAAYSHRFFKKDAEKGRKELCRLTQYIFLAGRHHQSFFP